jgi:dTDP-4-amino-4,6-dideoxygalactose transaminase
MFSENIYITKMDISADIYDTCISIPSSAGITQLELEEVVRQIKEFYATHP